MYVFVLDTSRIYIHISSYFKTSPTKYQYTFSLHTGLQIPLLKVRFVLDKGCSDIIWKKTHLFSFLINWQILIKLLSASTLNKSKQIMRKVKKLWFRRKKSNRLNDMCRVTGSKVMLMVLLFLVAIIQNFLIKSIIVKICKFRVS